MRTDLSQEHALLTLLENTWPPAFRHRVGPWALGEGQGGGRRVSALTAVEAWQPDDILLAEFAAQALDQPPVFMIRAEDGALDQALSDEGYHMGQTVEFWAGDCAALAEGLPNDGDLIEDPVTGDGVIRHWPPLAMADEIWQECGISEARRMVMARVKGPKAAILGRSQNQAAGVAFTAIAACGENDEFAEKCAMIHALEVRPSLRRLGTATRIIRFSAAWALNQGAKQIFLVVDARNTAARALYASLGMTAVGSYHYREKNK